MDFVQLKEKAASLPHAPGVYIMRNKADQVIYVGKAKKLKNRVSQYFLDTVSHSAKTRMMVSKIHQFDVIVAASEFEALVLECSLIKRYMPKYNILLKDDKGYPYLRIDMRDAFPVVTMVNRIVNDGAEYYGPFGSRGVTQNILQAIQLALKLPSCAKHFPADIGKGRPCLNYHMNQCEGWCQAGKKVEDYRLAAEQARQLLRGNYQHVAQQIREQMLDAAEQLKFELAANLRDRLNAVLALGQKQLVTAGTLADTDVIGYAKNESKACFTVLHFSNGNLLDKDYEILSLPDEDEQAVSSLMKQYYLSRGYAPKIVILPFPVEDSALFAQLLEEKYHRKPKIKIPQRGDNARLVELANKNALEEANRITDKEERLRGTLRLLEKMLRINRIERIEAFDISNISGTDIVASMVVFEGGKPKKSEYKRFKIEDLDNQNDLASMHQVVIRRFTHFLQADKGFETKPDLLLIDGGATHAQTAVAALESLNIQLSVFGMVKDDRHRTKALVTPNGELIRIDNQQAVFGLIGTIQEETHRFAVTYHRSLRSKRLKYSQLDQIPGIGPARKQLLLKTFHSITSISNASLTELERVLPKDAARTVYQHFQNIQKGESIDARDYR